MHYYTHHPMCSYGKKGRSKIFNIENDNNNITYRVEATYNTRSSNYNILTNALSPHTSWAPIVQDPTGDVGLMVFDDVDRIAYHTRITIGTEKRISEIARPENIAAYYDGTGI